MDLLMPFVLLISFEDKLNLYKVLNVVLGDVPFLIYTVTLPDGVILFLVLRIAKPKTLNTPPE